MENPIFRPDGITILDGALGTMLQVAGLKTSGLPELLCLTAPEQVTAIHRAYLAAGADIVYANTFGANRKKLASSGVLVPEVINSALQCARQARGQSQALVALDVGPLGELMEPVGTLSFEEAYDLFAEMMCAGKAAGADLIVVETMTDLYEAKAALLAAKEKTKLPVMVSMSFEESGRTFAGVTVEAMAATLAPLGAAALGINCSLGPARLMPLVKRLCVATGLPVFLKPNAGLPDAITGRHSLSPESFCDEMKPALAFGVAALGGCCGTTPETIARLAQSFKGKTPVKRTYIPQSVVCSGTRVVVLDGVCPIGERINPTGKRRLQEALRTGDLGYLQALAVEQQTAGAAILDVNVGAPGIDEVALLPQAVKAVQAVSDLPLQLDSANLAALEAALRVYNGKAVVNSTSGEEEKLQTILPLCKRYGAAVVGLALDEEGIPETSEGRFAVAEKILTAALERDIPSQDVYIDCLTLAASAGQVPAYETLRAVRLVKKRLGLKTVLGVSNVSFGLPERDLVNRTFLAMALGAGLDMPIINPAAPGMMDTIVAFRLLRGKDEGAKVFLGRFAVLAPPPPQGFAGDTAGTRQQAGAMPLAAAIEKGLREDAATATKQLLVQGEEGLSIVNRYLMPALDRVGQAFEKGTLFLPQLLAAAGAAQAAFDVIRAAMGMGAGDGPPVVIATVKGDVHDIGKNIAKVLLENYGFRVIDLGRDVPPKRVVQVAQEKNAKLVGLSALMTTTLPAMEETILALRAAGFPCKIMVGGAVLTEAYAQKIGADYYVKDAKASVDAAKEVYRVAEE